MKPVPSRRTDFEFMQSFMDPITFEKNVLVKYPFFFPLTVKLDMPKIVIRLIWICPVHSLQHNPYN